MTPLRGPEWAQVLKQRGLGTVDLAGLALTKKVEGPDPRVRCSKPVRSREWPPNEHPKTLPQKHQPPPPSGTDHPEGLGL